MRSKQGDAHIPCPAAPPSCLPTQHLFWPGVDLFAIDTLFSNIQEETFPETCGRRGPKRSGAAMQAARRLLDARVPMIKFPKRRTDSGERQSPSPIMKPTPLFGRNVLMLNGSGCDVNVGVACVGMHLISSTCRCRWCRITRTECTLSA